MMDIKKIFYVFFGIFLFYYFFMIILKSYDQLGFNWIKFIILALVLALLCSALVCVVVYLYKRLFLVGGGFEKVLFVLIAFLIFLVLLMFVLGGYFGILLMNF